MKNLHGPFGILLFLFLGICINTVAVASGKPVVADTPKVIIDTDLDSDVDDVGALAMLYNLHNAGRIELIGVIVTSDDVYAPECVAAMNRFYQLDHIPVGFLMNQNNLRHLSRYTKLIADEFNQPGEQGTSTEDAVYLYRKLLFAHADNEITVVTIGHLTSLMGLLQSAADSISDKNGTDLAHTKIGKWICMGGRFPAGKEANFYRPDPGSTIYCLSNWKKEILFCGWEAGAAVITGGEWLKKQLPEKHPVYRAYELYNCFAGRQSWDQMAVLQLLNASDTMFSTVPGKCIVSSDGSNTWTDDPNGLHRYVVINKRKETAIKYLINDLMADNHKF